MKESYEREGIGVIEANACKGHMHILINIPPKLSISQFMGCLERRDSLMTLDRHVSLRYKYENRQFWCKGYYVGTVGRSKKIIEEYIKNQIQEDLVYEQMSLKEHVDSFTGRPIKRSK